VGADLASRRVHEESGTLSDSVARVVVDVTGVDRWFDYLIPDHLAAKAVVGTRVRVPLHNRHVPGWIMAVLAVDDVTAEGFDARRLLPLEKVVSVGPDTQTVALIEWAARRWVSRRRPFFVTASPPRIVAALGAPQRGLRAIDGADREPWVEDLLRAPGPAVVQVGPHDDVASVVVTAALHGPTLVVAPMVSTARNIAARLRHRGASTALVPDDWARAASGVDVVVGARSAVWARIDGLASIVVVDEHDDSLQEERTPTWHARDVAIERAQRLGIPCLLVSPVPSIAARVAAANRRVVLASGARWPTVRIIDRSRDERWGSSLLSGELIDVLRDPVKRVVCVLNTKGRARLLTCNSCTRIVRCEACDAAMTQPDPDHLSCPRCAATRPVVCADCGATALRAVRRGVSRLREELEAAAGRPVVEVGTGDERTGVDAFVAGASVFVGTEAVLHRIDDADVVVLLDVDGELLAPRFRAAEATLELVVHAARRVRNARDGEGSGEVWLQTHHPDHDLLDGLRRGDLTTFVDAETQRRRALSLPPFGALARISGPGADDAADQLATSLHVSVARRDGEVLVRAATYDTLADELAHLARAKKSRWRVAVDPPRA